MVGQWTLTERETRPREGRRERLLHAYDCTGSEATREELRKRG